jgi:glycosyltransferase involved in cell wall biosynthesis
MSGSTSRVSVIIPTYNRVPYLGDAIRSVLAQATDGVETIVVDDGSTDGTEELLRAFDGSVTYLRVPHRGQPAATRNRGLQVARGEFVALLDSDDLFLPGKLARQCAAFAANADVALVYSNGYFFRDDPAAPLGWILDGLPSPSGDGFADLLRGCFLVPAVTLIRRRCLEAGGGFDEALTLRGVEDYDLWLRLAARLPLVESKVSAVAAGMGSRSCRRLSPLRRCLSPFHRSVSHLRSSNRTCALNASGSPTGFT